MLIVNRHLSIPDSEIQVSAIRAQGPGGQNVNKVATAVHLRFDIPASSLPEQYKQKLLALNDQRISKDGVVNIKANEYRSLQKNIQSARERLAGLIRQSLIIRKQRIKTKPGRSAQQKRLDSKRRHGQTKALRGKISE